MGARKSVILFSKEKIMDDIKCVTNEKMYDNVQ